MITVARRAAPRRPRMLMAARLPEDNSSRLPRDVTPRATLASRLCEGRRLMIQQSYGKDEGWIWSQGNTYRNSPDHLPALKRFYMIPALSSQMRKTNSKMLGSFRKWIRIFKPVLCVWLVGYENIVWLFTLGLGLHNNGTQRFQQRANKCTFLWKCCDKLLWNLNKQITRLLIIYAFKFCINLVPYISDQNSTTISKNLEMKQDQSRDVGEMLTLRTTWSRRFIADDTIWFPLT